MKKDNKKKKDNSLLGKKIAVWLMLIAMVLSYLSLCFMYM